MGWDVGEGEGWEGIPATRLLRSKFSVCRASRNTSASSMSRMHPHRLAKAKLVSRRLSTTSAVDPKSPAEGCQSHGRRWR